MLEDLDANLQRVQATIADAARRAQRAPKEVRLIAVTKTVPLGPIRQAIALGLRDFGENRMQEALPKVAALPELEWHFVGHLQTNKARDLKRGFRWIHSCDSLRLARVVAAQGAPGLAVLLEVNIAGESQKYGYSPDGLRRELPALTGLGLQLRGLMTIAPIARDPEAARPHFRALRRLRDELAEASGISLPELSMGMTDDYPVAVEEGATMIRLGRALFGARSLGG